MKDTMICAICGHTEKEIHKLLSERIKYKKMWNALKDQMMDTAVMDNLEVQYLGTRPKEELVNLAREILDIIRKSKLSFIKFKDEEEDV